jgi:hypothetical protein
MKEELKIKLLQKVSSENTEIQKLNFQTVLLILNSIHYNRQKTRDAFISERLQDSNLLLQKVMINGYSMIKLISGIQIPNIELKNFVTFNDPITLNTILRSLLETYLTFHHFNFAKLKLENEIRHKIWSYYGLYNRAKIKINTPTLTDQHKIVKENDTREMNQLLSEIMSSDLFLNLRDEKKKSFIKDLQRNWKVKFTGNTYTQLGYQDLLNSIGLRIEFYENQYNYLSWATHTTSILIYQLRQMYDLSWDKLELHNCLIKGCSLIAMSTVDLILNDDDYLPSYELLNQEHKDLLNFYSYYFRGDDFTIDKVD